MPEKVILGLIEPIKINGIEVKAKIDTGADRSSICRSLVNKLKLIPTGKNRIIKSSAGTEKRDTYEAEIEIRNKKYKTEFTVAKRDHLNYSILIGNDVLKKDFIIDPSR